MLRILLICLVSLAFVSGCVSTPLTIEEALARQVIFTVSNIQNNNHHSADSNDSERSGSNRSRQLAAEMRLKDVSSSLVVTNIIKKYKLKKVAQWSVKALGVEAIVAEYKGDQRIEDVLSELRGDLRVESVQPIRIYSLLGYNDPYFQLQHAIDGDDLEKIHRIATGKNVVVGLVDTGVDRNHPELAAQIIYSANFVSYDQAEFDNDEHGTSVAGVISSAANNRLGIVGVAPDAQLMLFKSCSQNIQSRKAFCDSFSLMKALVDVLKKEPDVLNLSLAGPDDVLLTRLIQAVLDKGIIVVAAVDAENQNHTFPASIPGVLAVNSALQLNVAVMPKHGVVAPGLEILTTTPGATYAFRSGSSMSTAYVSGIAALMKERNPALSNIELIQRLHESARGWIQRIPLVDVCHAVSDGMSEHICTSDTIAQQHD